MFRKALVATVVGSFLSASVGCSEWVAIKPAEAPKLNGETVAIVDTRAGGTIKTTTPVEKPDGTLTSIAAGFDLRVKTLSGEQMTFTHPVTVTVDGWAFVIRGGNRAATRFSQTDIVSIEVSQPDAGAAFVPIVILGVVLLGSVVTLGAIP